ncbi:MAG: hypothetical protein DRR19_11155 [Candidatus Parabeggiatoa sp. nov. 1]|nr:MAG: hypothetical protein DRR19_11155 [Gammaproteobacteria bacterium]
MGLRFLKANSLKKTWCNPVGVEFEFEAKVFRRKTLASNRLSGKKFCAQNRACHQLGAPLKGDNIPAQGNALGLCA